MREEKEPPDLSNQLGLHAPLHLTSKNLMTISQLVLGGSTVGTLGFKEQGRRIIRSIVITLQENEFYPPFNLGKGKKTILIL